ncbi:surfeit locus protein 6-domain-containing protein [Choanephora cucurbitarum]|nr:surfeit locus protein 6-domain-containing protein [Choanephora cucurbitarum]
MVQNHMIDALSERLQHDAQIFDDLLRLIPAKFYVMDKGDDAINSKFQHNKRKKAPKQAIKDATKKAKKAKLDPENAKSITQVQEEKAKQLKEESSDDDESDDQQDDEASVEDEKMEVDSGAFSGLDDQPAAEKVQEPVHVQPMEKGDIDQLRNRLHERINQLRKKRNAPGSSPSSPRSREDILAARNKKKEDRKKAIKAQKEKGNKVAPEELVKFDSKSSSGDKSRPSADSIKMDGDLFFGKLSVGKDQKKKKGPTDAKTQLKMLEAKKEKLEKLKDEDKSKADQAKEKEEWNKVIALATGEKPRDDAKLLKKAIKRQEKQKQKSSQEWNKRIDKVKMEEKNKIKKREDNIKAKIEEKKNKKRGIKVKPAAKKARPGFEGGKRSKGGKVTKPKAPNNKGKK